MEFVYSVRIIGSLITKGDDIIIVEDAERFTSLGRNERSESVTDSSMILRRNDLMRSVYLLNSTDHDSDQRIEQRSSL